MNADEANEAFRAQFKAWIDSQPKEVPCEEHPGSVRQIDRRKTRFYWQQLHDDDPINERKPRYGVCPRCHEERIQHSLSSIGVPPILLARTFDNWKPRDDAEESHLADCKEFAQKVCKGFLVLLGPVGVGKSHLAVAVARCFIKSPGCVWVTQNTLLRKLRATYRDPRADDPVEKCQTAPLLVLDDVGLSGGGRDEGPMLHEILDHRHGRQKPTVITSNLPWDDLRSDLGERIADRMKESAYRVLLFCGDSHRPESRERYFT